MAKTIANEQNTPPADEDLSKEIEQSMERQPNDRLKVVRLFDDCYRCNWWVQDKTPHPLWLATGTIRKSGFLKAKRTTEGLQIEHVAETGGTR